MNTTQLFFATISVVTTEIAVVLGFMFHGFTRLEGRMTAIESDLRRFYQILGEHTGDLNSLKEKK